MRFRVPLVLAVACLLVGGAPEIRTAEALAEAESAVVIQHGGAHVRQLERTHLLRLVRVESVDSEEQPDTPGLRLTFRNESEQPLTAAVMVFRGESARDGSFEFTSLFDGRLIPGVHDSPVLPETTTAFEVAPPFRPDVLTVEVDFVEFADSTTAGADGRKVSERIRLRREGALLAVQYLRNRLFEQGLPELLRILEGEPGARTPAIREN